MAAITHIHDCDDERRDSPTAIDGDFRDVYLAEQNPDSNWDSGSGGWSLSAGVSQAGGGKSGDPRKDDHTILRYDLNAFIPADAIITAAVIWFYVNSTGATAFHTFAINRLATTDWKEAEASWNNAKSGSSWPTAGGDYTTPQVLIGTITTTGWKNYDITTIVTDAWSNRSGICNLLLRRYDVNTDAGRIIFRAKNIQPYQADKPHHLRITYTLDGKTFQAYIL